MKRIMKVNNQIVTPGGQNFKDALEAEYQKLNVDQIGYDNFQISVTRDGEAIRVGLPQSHYNKMPETATIEERNTRVVKGLGTLLLVSRAANKLGIEHSVKTMRTDDKGETRPDATVFFNFVDALSNQQSITTVTTTTETYDQVVERVMATYDEDEALALLAKAQNLGDAKLGYLKGHLAKKLAATAPVTETKTETTEDVPF